MSYNVHETYWLFHLKCTKDFLWAGNPKFFSIISHTKFTKHSSQFIEFGRNIHECDANSFCKRFDVINILIIFQVTFICHNHLGVIIAIYFLQPMFQTVQWLMDHEEWWSHERSGNCPMHWIISGGRMRIPNFQFDFQSEKIYELFDTEVNTNCNFVMFNEFILNDRTLPAYKI